MLASWQSYPIFTSEQVLKSWLFRYALDFECAGRIAFDEDATAGLVAD